MHVDSQTLKDAVGLVATGPAGFGIHHEVKNGAEINAGTTTVETEVNQPSLAQAHAQNEGGTHKEFAEKHGRIGTASKALDAVAMRLGKAEQQYASLFGKHNLQGALNPKLGPQPQSASRGPYAALSPENNAKNVLKQRRERQFLALRRTFDQVAMRKSVPMNMERLPYQIKANIVEAAMLKGETNTPLGPVQQAAEKFLPKFQYKQSFDIRAWRRWQHALMDGSFIDMPHMKGGA